MNRAQFTAVSRPIHSLNRGLSHGPIHHPMRRPSVHPIRGLILGRTHGHIQLALCSNNFCIYLNRNGWGRLRWNEMGPLATQVGHNNSNIQYLNGYVFVRLHLRTYDHALGKAMPS